MKPTVVNFSGIAFIFLIFGMAWTVAVKQQYNVFGDKLEVCSLDPITGWYRDGYAHTDDQDHGLHTVCATMTKEFLDYTKGLGNDLSTPRGGFPGLKPGDRWALCAARWLEAFRANKAPLVKLSATNKLALNIVTLDQLISRDDQTQSP